MTVFRALRELPRPIGLVFFATLVNRTGTMALPFLIVYLTKERDFPPETAGAVLGLYGAGALSAGPLAGWLVGKVGARAVMTVSLCASGAITLAIPFVEDVAPGAVIVFLWALTAESFRPACAAVVAEHARPEQRRSAYAVLRLAVNLGMTIGPAIAGFLAEHSYTALFVFDAATSVAAALTLLSRSGRVLDTKRAAQVAATENGASPPVMRRLAIHLIGVALVAVVAYQGISTMPLYMTQDLALSEAVYGLVFALSGAIIVLFEVPLTTMLGHWSYRRLLVLGALLTGIGFGSLAAATSLAGVVATTFVWTLGEMLFGPATSAKVADLEPPHRRGLFVGVHNAVWSAAFAFGPWLGTHVYGSFGPVVHWILVGATGIAAAGLFLTGRDRYAATQAART